MPAHGALFLLAAAAYSALVVGAVELRLLAGELSVKQKILHNYHRLSIIWTVDSPLNR